MTNVQNFFGRLLGNFGDDATAWRSPEAIIFYFALAVIVGAKAM